MVHQKRFYVYILTNWKNTVLYTGVTSDLLRRIYVHKQKLVKGFTSKYNVNKLVYFEEYSDSLNAIQREKQIKAGSRARKNKLVDEVNPQWRDLFEDLSE